MAQNTVESIFNSKKNLSDFYPEFPGVSIFDLENKHLFYGRMDKEGDAIYLDDSNLKQLRGGTSQLANRLQIKASFQKIVFIQLI